MGAKIMVNARGPDRASKSKDGYTIHNEFMAHLEGLLPKDHPVLVSYQKEYKDRLKRSLLNK